tara:strand:- start:384 stop:1067 length:684 start_codon:yes stop_codon:yes gene_type:complete
MTDNISISDAFNIIFSLNDQYLEIILLSLQTSLGAVIISSFLFMPLAALMVITNYRGKNITIIFVNSLMGLPPVVVGLFLYLILSAQGPLSAYKLLYTPSAMLIAQIIIITPIIISLSIESLKIYFNEYQDYFKSIGVSKINIILTLLSEARNSLSINFLAGLGRALAEVGAVIIVGGNIAHQTRVMTTSIVLETSRGELSMAMSLGITLILISILLNILLFITKEN